MTIIEAIRKIDELKPNTYTQEEKTAWLSTVEGMIKHEIIDTHMDGEKIFFDGYNADTPVDTEMIVYPPYDELYILWLESKIDYTNGEYVKYNNAVIRYNEVFQQFANDYNRRHMPKGKHIRYY